MTTLYQGVAIAAFILSEANGQLSRDNGDLAASQDIVSGQVLGRVAAASGAVTVNLTVGDENTAGGGVLTLASPAYTTAVKDGRYSVVCIEPAANGGKFRVEDPNGNEVGTATVGAAFTKQVKFTIADATDFVAGDAFYLDVVRADPAAVGQYKPVDAAATDGTERAAAISLTTTQTGVGETKPIALFRRLGEVNGFDLGWPEDATTDQKAAWIADLEALHIIVR